MDRVDQMDKMDYSALLRPCGPCGPAAEISRGQKQQSADDVVLLSYLMNNCDSVERTPRYDDAQGNRAVEVKKRINGVAIVATIERGAGGVYTISKFETMSAASMSRAPWLNALSDADVKNIQRDLAKIKSDAENSSKVIDANGEPKVVYHGTFRQERLRVLDPAKGQNANAVWHSASPAVAMFFGDWRIARFDETLPDRIRNASDLKELRKLAREELGINVSVIRNEITPEQAKQFGVVH